MFLTKHSASLTRQSSPVQTQSYADPTPSLLRHRSVSPLLALRCIRRSLRSTWRFFFHALTPFFCFRRARTSLSSVTAIFSSFFPVAHLVLQCFCSRLYDGCAHFLSTRFGHTLQASSSRSMSCNVSLRLISAPPVPQPGPAGPCSHAAACRLRWAASLPGWCIWFRAGHGLRVVSWVLASSSRFVNTSV